MGLQRSVLLPASDGGFILGSYVFILFRRPLRPEAGGRRIKIFPFSIENQSTNEFTDICECVKALKQSLPESFEQWLDALHEEPQKPKPVGS